MSFQNCARLFVIPPPKLTQPTVLDPPLNVGNWFPNSYANFIAAARCCFPDIIKNLQFDGDENDLYQGE